MICSLMKKSKFTVCDRMTQVCDKKLLLQRGIDPMPLAFKASPITCFRGKWDRIRATRFQGKCHVHHTSGATLY